MLRIINAGRGRASLLLTVVWLLVGSPCQAASDRSILEDAKLYVTAPVRWQQRDWLYASSSILAIAAAHQYDDRVQRHFADATTLDGKDTHSTRDALPALAVLVGTGTFAWLWDDAAGYQETRDMLEAGAFAAVTTFALKQVVRRDRPAANTGSGQWFGRGDSFPSRHVSVAVAIGTVLAESGGDDYRWLRRGLGYGVGAAAMYARLQHQQHWLSDTVAGAALGIATARFVLNRSHAQSGQSAFILVPDHGGVLLSYATAFN